MPAAPIYDEVRIAFVVLIRMRLLQVVVTLMVQDVHELISLGPLPLFTCLCFKLVRDWHGVHLACLFDDNIILIVATYDV